MRIVIFTNLDGTLLDHDTYSFSHAIPALKQIKKEGIPLILCSSKTRREIISVQEQLDIREPFVVENGAAVYFPTGYKGLFPKYDSDGAFVSAVQLGVSYGRIRSFVHSIKDRFHVHGFGDISLQEVSRLTGLSAEYAELAMWREHTEPCLMDSVHDLATLQSLAADRGIKIIKGERFYHMMGMLQDKGRAVRIVRDLLNRCFKKKHLAIGIGNNENDVPMLNQVDIPILFPKYDGTYLDLALPFLLKANHAGSKGWKEVIEDVLDRYVYERT